MRSLFWFLMLALVAFPAMSTPAQSIRDSRELLDVLSVMGEIAAEGPSLSYFGWSEDHSSTPPDAECNTASRRDAALYLQRLIKEMDWMTPAQDRALNAQFAPALADLERILERDDLLHCEWGRSEQRSYTKYVRFQNRVTGYRVTFMEGYED